MYPEPRVEEVVERVEFGGGTGFGAGRGGAALNP
jgi:hypothetical protein